MGAITDLAQNKFPEFTRENFGLQTGATRSPLTFTFVEVSRVPSRLIRLDVGLLSSTVGSRFIFVVDCDNAEHFSASNISGQLQVPPLIISPGGVVTMENRIWRLFRAGILICVGTSESMASVDASVFFASYHAVY
jgi:hypothetical protein